MKQLTPQELQKAANILWALDHTEPLEIIQYVRGQQDPPTYRQIAEVIGISDSLVKYNASRLEQEGIITAMPVATLEDPEAGLVMLKELADMPTLAQAILLELWPDWYDLPEVKAPLISLQPIIDLAARPLSVSLPDYTSDEEIKSALKRAKELGYDSARISVTIVGNGKQSQPKIQMRTGFNVPSGTENWIDLLDPEAVWNRTTQLT